LPSELEPIDYYDQQNKVVELMLKGTKPRQIAKELAIRPVDVDKHISEWQGYARNNKHIQERAREALSATDQHYDMIISGLWSVVSEAESNSDYKVKKDTYKTIADVERQRIEMLQKAGLLDNQHLAEQVLQAEKDLEIVMDVLRVAANKYPDAAAFIKKELGRVSGQAESTVISVESA
jgi:hypothetical protein